MKKHKEVVIMLAEILEFAQRSCFDCPRRDFRRGNRDIPDELACYEDCEDRQNYQELIYSFNDLKAAEPKDRNSKRWDEWAELHDCVADEIGRIKSTCEVFQHD